jgi:hypothetical protein
MNDRKTSGVENNRFMNRWARCRIRWLTNPMSQQSDD